MPLRAASPKEVKKFMRKKDEAITFFTDSIGRLIWLNTFIVDAYFKYILFKIM